ncbi:spermidine/putrescine ABC transporter ATP-binding protein [Bacillus sp. TE8-1]|nr:spermidine/putrescine ABC transporter ATP-binding protein [Bacillus sp. TE8-1]
MFILLFVGSKTPPQNSAKAKKLSGVSTKSPL